MLVVLEKSTIKVSFPSIYVQEGLLLLFFILFCEGDLSFWNLCHVKLFLK